MDAEKVWGVWRRILRETPVRDALFTEDFPARAPMLGLNPEETAIALAYASTPNGTRFAITTYQYRLVSSVSYALETCTPLTWRVLLAAGCDTRELSRQYLDATGWHDDGPFVYRRCRRILNYLRDSELGATAPGLRDVIAVEGAAVDLVQGLARAPHITWPAAEERETFIRELSAWRFQQTGTGAVVTTEHTLTPWLRDTSVLGKTPLLRQPQHFLVYLRSPTETFKLVGIGRLGTIMFQLLETPHSFAELGREAALLAPADSTASLEMLQRFLRLGVVRGVPLPQ